MKKLILIIILFSLSNILLSQSYEDRWKIRPNIHITNGKELVYSGDSSYVVWEWDNPKVPIYIQGDTILLIKNLLRDLNRRVYMTDRFAYTLDQTVTYLQKIPNWNKYKGFKSLLDELKVFGYIYKKN